MRITDSPGAGRLGEMILACKGGDSVAEVLGATAEMRRLIDPRRRHIGVGDASLTASSASEWRGDDELPEHERLLTALTEARWTFATAAPAAPVWAQAAPTDVHLVKRGDCRAIYRVDLPHGSVYVKHRWSPGWLGRLLDRLRGSASRREFRHSHEAAHRGVPTTHCLAFGESNAADEFLVTRTVHDAEPLDQFLAARLASLTPNARRALIESLAALCARAHEAGLEHDDLHAGNILIVWRDHARRPDLRLIDLDRARLGKPLSWRATRRNLAMLFCGLHHVATPRDCWRFWRAYRRLRPAIAVDPHSGARAIRRRGLDRVWRILRDRDRRALRSNREFVTLRTAGGVALAVRDEPRRSLAELLQAPVRLLQGPGMQALKLSFGSAVVKTAHPSGAGEIVYKRIRAKSLWKRFLAPFRPSRARVGWYRGQALLARGIATARPLFALEPRPARWWGESYLATEWISGALSLHVFLWHVATLPERERREITRHGAASLGALLGKMHRYGVAHRDLKGCNLAAAEQDGVLRWYVLDLDGVRLRRRVPFAERASDLARLAVSAEIHPCLSRADRWRFLRSYCRASGDAIDIKELWRAIACDSRRELARFARSGKRVA